MNQVNTDASPLDIAFELSSGPMQFSYHYLCELCKVLEKINQGHIGELIGKLYDCRTREGTIYFCGNGGKAALCQEWVNDLTVALPNCTFRAQSLMDNVAALTAASNDYTYDSALTRIFVPQSRPGDLLVALSGSGNSTNILHVVEQANIWGIETIGIGRGGQLKEIVKLFVEVPAQDDGPTEDAMMMLVHVCHAWFIRYGK